MTKKIFRSILIVASAVLAAGFLIVLGFLYEYYAGIQEQQLKTQTALVARAVENEGAAYFEGFSAEGCRVSWIDADGTVLYDSSADAATLENHADREEFIEAVKSGFGASTRYSATLTERMLYTAQRLSDGTVVRLASAHSTVLSLFLGMLQPVCLVLIGAVILSAVLASRLAKRIVKPLNALNLDTPLENETYDELSPLLTRIEQQHRQIDRQRRELQRRREEWNAVTGSMNEGILLLSEENAVLSLNKSAARLLDAPEDCIGSDLLAVCRRLEIQQLLQKAARGEKAEAVVGFANGEYQIDASPVMSGGKVKGTALLFFNVTDKIQAEQMRREFTANVSHELKTPLHIISGTAELLKNGLVEPEDQSAFIERIYTESQRMVVLIDDIIELSRLDEGARDAPREQIDLKSMAESVLCRLAPEAQKAEVTLTLNGTEAAISGVPALIAELLYNLCDNAVKYNRPGGSVTVGIEERQAEVVLTVSDTGIGIPPEAQGRVFERFYRVDKSRSKEIGGTGLGLSIVKHVARLHHANLLLTSTPGQGSTFAVVFPR